MENAELEPLALSLTGLVAMTVVFEVVVHNVKHAAHTWETREVAVPVIEKINAELTVLGFISFTVLLSAQALAESKTFARHLPELEVAHVWLFFVGMMYVS